MSLIRRNTTRTVYSNAETTAKTDTPSEDVLAFNLGTSDKFYVGFRAPFASRHFFLKQVSTDAGAISVKYWNGTEWTAVTDLIDQTEGFTKSGFLAWKNATDWAKRILAPTNEELFWVEVTTTAALSSNTQLQSVLNLFVDDSLMRAYYPQFLTDDRWLPEGRTDFLEQYNEASRLVATRLKQAEVITDESMILDVDQVSAAAVHAAAYLITLPTARGEEQAEYSMAAYKAMDRELSKVKFTFDTDNSGVAEADEKDNGNSFRVRR